MDTIPPLSLPILLDGATGSELYKRGMPAGACTEQWVLGHPEALLELQRGYVAAGSQVLIAPTFGANRVRLEQHGIFGQVADYNRRLVELSRQAAGGRALVAGDMAPTGLFIAPFGESPGRPFESRTHWPRRSRYAPPWKTGGIPAPPRPGTPAGGW